MSILLAQLFQRNADFLHRFRGRTDLAERYYRRALAIDPAYLPARGRFAVFCETVRRDFDAAEAQYRAALALAPNDPVLLGNWADFLEHARGDLDEAERYYRRALEVAPLHPNNLTNYATFLAEVRGEHDRAESLYQRALQAAPYHRNGLFKYALFLTDVRKAFADALALYERALAVAPENGAIRANRAGLLLLMGRREEGLQALVDALRLPVLQQPTADAAECWFYAVVYGATGGQVQALGCLARLIKAGVRSAGFQLGPHVAQARELEHPWLDWLDPLARVLVGEAPAELLAGWPAWRAADPGVLH